MHNINIKINKSFIKNGAGSRFLGNEHKTEAE
jgi:hypothetical protein